MKKILLISNHPSASQFFDSNHRKHFEIDHMTDLASGLARFRQHRYEYTFFDVQCLHDHPTPPGSDFFKKALRAFWEHFPNAYLIALASCEFTRHAVQAVKAGADDYLLYPVTPAELELVMDRAAKQSRQAGELEYLRNHFWNKEAETVIQSSNQAMQGVFAHIQAVAPTHASVFLSGETGVGKSLIARIIHEHSGRAKAPFIAVNCGAIPDTLIESELFGHERGAFTGAFKRKLGRFELAHCGTIFLDEIGNITASAQAKILQVLQEGTFQRVGGETEVHTDIRVIAATNENLKELVNAGSFRKDLYYRLNVFPIEIPPLRSRPEDIPYLIQGFLARHNRRYEKNITGVDETVLTALQRYPWPGNIRELANLVERAYILETSDHLRPQSFPMEIFQNGEVMVQNTPPMPANATLAEARQIMVEAFERQYLHLLLSEKKGRIQATAQVAGISVRQLHKLMRKYNLDKSAYKTSIAEESSP